MSSPYYHAFTPGFNWWYLFAIGATILAAICAWRRPIAEGDRIRLRHSKASVACILNIMTCILAVMIVAESWTGIIQFMDNGARGTESVVSSYGFAGIAVVICGAVFRGVLCVVDRFFVNLRKEELKAQWRRAQS